jgi:hypothetical protein
MDDYFEYLLRDPNYMGEEMFIMKHVGRKELALNANQNAFKTFKKMNVEWGTGALNGKWKCLIKQFNSTKPKYTHIFQAITLFTCFFQ